MRKAVVSPLIVGALAVAVELSHDALTTARAAEVSTTSSAQARTSAQTPVVSVVAVNYSQFTETVQVTGSLAAREEVLVGPEIEGLKVVEILVEAGAWVKQGQLLARLSRDALNTQLAQNAAGLARANAVIEQARLFISETEALQAQAAADLERADKLHQSGTASAAVFDQRQAAALAAKAKFDSAKRGLTAAEADKAQYEAQRRELEVRVGQTEIKAPATGIVSRRAARLGALVSGGGDPLFRIAEHGEIELDAEVAETNLPKLRPDMAAQVEVLGLGERSGRIRLILPEIDKSSRLGRARISLGVDPALRIGAYARAVIEVASSKGLAVPAASVLYTAEGPVVQVVRGKTVETRPVGTGLSSSAMVEIRSGLSEGEIVVARAGAFLRDGDAVRPVSGGVTALNGPEGAAGTESR